ncbi:PASTA domain-containing protein [Syntrophorhabdus aromaticivorans]|jgi:beta-lactam-binding protein with PASTA domain|uniref:PASTA domain-containing protein n=1 Tax=Syntrophorhabdus aromaticivorans TaxID=328301 RepID=UPI00040DAA26|nr:PASTA domain-containing protein [Syntrophorhabdus aromaticivorans]
MIWKRGLLYLLAPVVVFGLATYLTIDILLRTSDTVVCPDIRGKTVEEAREMTKNAGLSLLVMRYENRNDVPYNHITVQKPEANIATRKGRMVYVIVSEGPHLAEVPALAGRSLQEAEGILKEKKLKPGRVVEIPNTAAGKVIAQMPMGGEKSLEGHEVVIFVGSNKNTYYLMPDVQKIGLTELQDEMDAKGIKYRIEYTQGYRPARPNISGMSVPVRSLFKADNETLIYINNGGQQWPQSE